MNVEKDHRNIGANPFLKIDALWFHKNNLCEFFAGKSLPSSSSYKFEQFLISELNLLFNGALSTTNIRLFFLKQSQAALSESLLWQVVKSYWALRINHHHHCDHQECVQFTNNTLFGIETQKRP